MLCVGSSVGLMLVLVALARKLLPPHAAVDVPLALRIVGLGIATVL